jgi:hypothetical protein
MLCPGGPGMSMQIVGKRVTATFCCSLISTGARVLPRRKCWMATLSERGWRSKGRITRKAYWAETVPNV